MARLLAKKQGPVEGDDLSPHINRDFISAFIAKGHYKNLSK